MEIDKQREIEAHVAAARSEYEVSAGRQRRCSAGERAARLRSLLPRQAVMNDYERSTEAWRRDTVAACERSLDAARLQVRHRGEGAAWHAASRIINHHTCRLRRREHRLKRRHQRPQSCEKSSNE